jgi:hypothetical protein
LSGAARNLKPSHCNLGRLPRVSESKRVLAFLF